MCVCECMCESVCVCVCVCVCVNARVTANSEGKVKSPFKKELLQDKFLTMHHSSHRQKIYGQT